MDLDVLYRTHARYVASIALRLLGRDEEVDDVVQEVFLRAVRSLETSQGEPAVRGWLRVVTVRLVVRRLRRRRLLKLFVPPDSYESLPAPGATPEELTLLRRVYSALDDLPVDLRVAWLLRHGEGEALEDVAAACECSLATVKRRIAQASARLAEVLR